ncbi:MAG TPA: hypothetical protein VEC14_01110 [Reyranellaceae bacterium]|nr:hypothetical protein [Reyranellaceae bacterium]
MTRPKTRRAPADTPAATPDAGPAAAPDVMHLPDDDGAGWLDSLGEGPDLRVRVYRRISDGADVFLFWFPVKQYDGEQLLDVLRDKHGGGTFLLRARRTSGQWVGSARTVHVERRELPAAPAAAALPADTGMPSMYTMMIDAQRRSDEMLRMVLDSMRQQPQQLGFADVIKAAQLMQPGAAQTAASPLATVKEMLEVQKLLGERGGGDGTPDWASIIRDLAVPVAQAIAANAAKGGEGAPAALPAPAGAPAPVGAAPAAQPPQNAAHAALRHLLARLVRAAEKDSDPSAYAVVVIDEVGEANAQQLLDQVPLEVLLQLEPRAVQYREWFEEFIAAAREELQPDPTSTNAATGSDDRGAPAQ